jgi:hypothetical protein
LFALGAKSLWSFIQERSNQEPTAEWARTVPQEKMATSFDQGGLLRFEPREVTIVRESRGLVHVTLKGSAMTRGAFYEEVSNEDSAVLPQSKLAEWRKARERALFLQQRAGTNVAAADQPAFQFVRETTPLGKTVEFQFQFKARRDGTDWHVDRVVAADLVPADALRGKAITEFSSPAILGTDKANHDRARLIEKIDKYIADVGKANALALKRFTKEGRDADGNLLFPADRAMAGERFAQTRMRILAASEAQNWSDDDLQHAINEVYARHGRRFEDKKIAPLFTKQSWYHPRADLSNQQIEESLSDIEVQNIMMLHSVIVARKENEERLRQAAIAQQRAQDAERARQQAEAQERARQEAVARQRWQQAEKERQDAEAAAAAAALFGGLIQGLLNHR